MTPGTKSGGGAEKDKHSAENDKNSAENDEIQVPKKSAETGGNRRKVLNKLINFIACYRRCILKMSDVIAQSHA
jgi:hypothetical protein